MKALRLALVLLLAAAAVGSAVVAYREYLLIQDLRAGALTPEERSRLQKAAWAAEARARKLESELATARAAPAAAAAAADPSHSGNLNTILGTAAAEYLARMDDPEIRRLTDLQRLAQINRQFATFYKNAHLSPEQLAQFQRLLLERQNVPNDVLMAATQQGINPLDNQEEFRQMVQSAQADVDKQIQQSLGADTYAQFQAFQQGQGQRNVVSQLQQDLSYTDAPLSGAQRDQMSQVLAQSNPKGGSEVNDQTISLASGVLSAPQLEALRNVQQLQQANRQLQTLMMQRRGGGP
jgi:hypothetical protein